MKKEIKETYPRIYETNWWILRKKIASRVPQKIDEDYLQSILNINEGAAANLKRELKRIGFIDEECNTLNIVSDWRFEENYQKICQNIIEKVYPAKLRDLYSGTDLELKKVAEWFSRNTITGKVAGEQMARFYILLNEADPNKQNRLLKEKGKGLYPKTAKAKRIKTTPSANIHELNTPKDLIHELETSSIPSLHIDIQIHIAADTKPEQMDHIFQSMAKHLYGKK